MASVSFKVSKREVSGKAVSSLREQGQVPGILYGQGKQSITLQADAKTLDKVYQDAGTSKLIDLSIDEASPTSTLFYDVQRDPVTHKILHFDLYDVKDDEEIHTEVPLHFIGESEAVIAQQADMVKNLESVEIKALPRHLPENLEVDVSQLKAIGDSISVSDLRLPEGVEVLTEADVRIVGLEEIRVTDEADFEEVEQIDADQVESEHGGAEGEEGAEGESSAAGGDGKTGDKAESPEAAEGDQQGKSDADKKAA